MNRMLLFGVILFLGYNKTSRETAAANTFSIKSPEQLQAYKLANAIRCFAGSYETPIDNIPSIPLLKGRGIHVMKVSTHNDSAFLYFNQGINMFYGFHFIEARASFKKAQNFDSAFALSYLGEVVTYGPNINNPAYKLPSYVAELMKKAERFASGASAYERALVEAQAYRYRIDTSLGLQ